MVFGHLLTVKQGGLFRDRELGISIDFVTEVLKSEEITAFRLSSLWKKCVSITVRGKHYVIPIVNTVETD